MLPSSCAACTADRRLLFFSLNTLKTLILKLPNHNPNIDGCTGGRSTPLWPARTLTFYPSAWLSGQYQTDHYDVCGLGTEPKAAHIHMSYD